MAAGPGPDRRANQKCRGLSGRSRGRRRWLGKARSAVCVAYLLLRRKIAQTLKAYFRRRAGGQFLSSSASWLGVSELDSSIAGSLITYFSLAQAPRSSSLQRSLQNGNSALASESVGLRQIGQWNVMGV